MKVAWSCDEDEILIKFVRAHDILYNVKHTKFRHAEVKQKLWCNVAKTLNKTAPECYKRWCYVRDYYMRRKGKIINTGAGEASKRRAKLLSFMDQFSLSSKNLLDIDMQEENDQDGSDQNQDSEDVTSDNEVIYFEDSTTYNENDDNIDGNDEDCHSQFSRKRKRESKDPLKKFAQKRQSTENLDETTYNENDDSIDGNDEDCHSQFSRKRKRESKDPLKKFAQKRQSTENLDETTYNENDDSIDGNDEDCHSQFSRKRKRESKDPLKKFAQKRQSTENLDETDLFFCAMAKIVKKLPRHQQIQLRMKIGTLVGDTEMRSIANETSAISSLVMTKYSEDD